MGLQQLIMSSSLMMSSNLMMPKTRRGRRHGPMGRGAIPCGFLHTHSSNKPPTNSNQQQPEDV